MDIPAVSRTSRYEPPLSQRRRQGRDISGIIGPCSGVLTVAIVSLNDRNGLMISRNGEEPEGATDSASIFQANWSKIKSQ